MDNWSCTINLLKILTAIFLLAPAANMLGTSRLLIGCMIWQHAVFLESICQTNSIIKFFPAEGTGFLTPLLTCSPSLFFYLFFEQTILSPTSFLPFIPWTNYSQVPFSRCFLWTKYFKSKIFFPLCLFGQKILGQIFFLTYKNSSLC